MECKLKTAFKCFDFVNHKIPKWLEGWVKVDENNKKYVVDFFTGTKIEVTAGDVALLNRSVLPWDMFQYCKATSGWTYNNVDDENKYGPEIVLFTSEQFNKLF